MQKEDKRARADARQLFLSCRTTQARPAPQVRGLEKTLKASTGPGIG